MALEIKKLTAGIEKKDIIKDITLTVKPGEIHVIMGPNGSGKSTLALALLGHPKYSVRSGTVRLNGKDISKIKTEEKARLGLFLSSQHSPEFQGVTLAHFLRVLTEKMTGRPVNPFQFYDELRNKIAKIGLDRSFAGRYLNVGFSGGERKKSEILQLGIAAPKYAILDETDAGLDADALKLAKKEIKKLANNKVGIIIITHQSNLLKTLSPTRVHIMSGGKIIRSGKMELVKQVEKNGYKNFV